MVEPLPTVALRIARAGNESPLVVPDQLHPAPENLPAPVTYQGYSAAQWKQAMILSGCDKLSMYQKKHRKNKKQNAIDNNTAVAAILHAMETGRHGAGAQAEGEEDPYECTIVGALRDKRGAVQVAVLWEAPGKAARGEWIAINKLVDTAPGSENHKLSFGQEREGEVIIVQWESTRRYIAHLQTWSFEDDSFDVLYEPQGSNTALKTSQTAKQTHSFRLDTLATPDLADINHHSWWVCAKHASMPFVSKRLMVDMTGICQVPNPKRTRTAQGKPQPEGTQCAV